MFVSLLCARFLKVCGRENNFKTMKGLLTKGIFFIVLIHFCGTLSAQQLVYKPVNPAFGGDSFNYSWMINSAQAQDLLKDPNIKSTSSLSSSFESFQRSLNSQLLSQLSRNLISDQFGEDGLSDGSYSIGGLNVDVISDLDGITISILDTESGEQTQVSIPFY